MRLKAKLTLNMLTVALLPVLLVAVISVNHAILQAKALTLQKAQGYLQAGAGTISEFFSSRKSEIAVYASTPLLKSLNFSQIDPFLKSELRKRDDIYEKFIFGLPNGHFYNTSGGNSFQGGIRTFNDNDPQAKPKSISTRDYWKATLGENLDNQERIYTSNPMISFTTGVKQVVVAATVLSDDQKARAMLGGAIPWVKMDELISIVKSNIVEKLGGKARFMLVSQDGTYWYHWDPEKIVHVKKDKFGNPLRNATGEKVVVKRKIVDEDQAELRDVGHLMKMARAGIVDYVDNKSMERNYLIFAPIKSASYSIGVVVPEAAIMAPVNRLERMFFYIVIGVVLIVVLLSFSVSSKILKPINSLHNATNDIIQGKDYENLTVKNRDEIGELTNNFNLMSNILQKREREVRALNVELEQRVKDRTKDLEHQKQDLEKVNLELDSFVYTASHDLSAPLRGIASFANFLERDYGSKLDDEGKRYVGKIQKAASRLSQIIDDLLTLSRISRIENPYEYVRIHDLIGSVLQRIEFDIEDLNVDVIVQQNMPDVYCDKIKVSEVFLNLINNGIKFSSKNKDSNPRIEIGCKIKSECYEFFVKDNGIGVDPEYHDQIFGIFKRLHQKSEFEGTGAGLSIVQRIVNEHHGKVWVESKLGEGATFYFTISSNLRKT